MLKIEKFQFKKQFCCLNKICVDLTKCYVNKNLVKLRKVVAQIPTKLFY